MGEWRNQIKEKEIDLRKQINLIKSLSYNEHIQSYLFRMYARDPQNTWRVHLQ